MTKNEIYYRASRDTVLYQNEVHKDFSTRAMNFVGYGVAMLAAGAIALNLPDDGISFNTGMLVALVFWGGGFIALVLSCAYVLFAHRWEMGTTVDSLGELIDDNDYDTERVLWCIADRFRTSFTHNRTVLNKKARAINVAMVALAMEAAGLISVGVLLLSQLAFIKAPSVNVLRQWVDRLPVLRLIWP